MYGENWDDDCNACPRHESNFSCQTAIWALIANLIYIPLARKRPSSKFPYVNMVVIWFTFVSQRLITWFICLDCSTMQDAFCFMDRSCIKGRRLDGLPIIFIVAQNLHKKGVCPIHMYVHTHPRSCLFAHFSSDIHFEHQDSIRELFSLTSL